MFPQPGSDFGKKGKAEDGERPRRPRKPGGRRDEEEAYDLLAGDRPGPTRPAGGRRRRRLRMTPREIGLLGVSGLMVLSWVAHLFWRSASTPCIERVCQSCKNLDLWEMQPGQKFPVRCRVCGRKTALPAAGCRECGKLRALEGLYDTSPCPHCKKTHLVHDLEGRCPVCGEELSRRGRHNCPPN